MKKPLRQKYYSFLHWQTIHVLKIHNNTRIMITNSTDADAYPISGMTWIILYKEQAYKGRTKEQAEATLKLLDWVIDTDAQLVAPQVHYAPLRITSYNVCYTKLLRHTIFVAMILLYVYN